MTAGATSGRESVFTMDTSSIKYGAGATCEIGDDVRDSGLTRIMLFSDPNLVSTNAYATARDSLRAAGRDVIEYSDVRVEPTDASFATLIYPPASPPVNQPAPAPTDEAGEVDDWDESDDVLAVATS